MRFKENEMVVCINKEHAHLTVGKIYETYYVNGMDCWVTNDNEVGWFYPIDYFITLSEWREHQINKIL